MADQANGEAKEAGKGVLDPLSRISESLFGLIMAMTFTCSLGVADAGRNDVRAMLIGALGCNIAWGLIDAVFYLMNTLASRGGGLLAYRAVRRSDDPQQARDRIAEAIPPIIASVITREELDALRQRLQALPEPPSRARLEWSDWRGAAGVFCLVFLITFPVAIPFIWMDRVDIALRVSNAIAAGLLFFLGYAYGRLSGFRPLLAGSGMVVLAVILVATAIALGG